MTSDPVLIFVDPIDDNDIMLNGEFAGRTWPWIMNTFETAKATFSIEHEGWLSDSSSAIIDIEEGGSATWNIQLVQYVALDSGHTYEVSYIMDAIEQTNVNVSMHLDVDPYTGYWSNQSQLNELVEYGPFTFECTVNDPRTRFNFGLGMNQGQVYIDAVKLVDLNWEDTHFTGIETKGIQAVSNYSLRNYPNPFNPTTSIEFTIPQVEHVNITIYNLLGEKVKSLVNGRRAAGTHTIQWDGRDDYGNIVNSGCYIYKIISGDYTAAHRMLFLK